MSLFRSIKEFLGNTQIVGSNGVDPVLVVQSGEPSSGQTGKLQEWRSSAGTVVASVDKSGVVAIATADNLTVGGVVVPQRKFLAFQAPIATAAVSQSIFIADAAYQVTAVNEVHGVASSSGTVTVEKLTGTTAPGSGTAMLTGTISTAGTANTVVAGTLTGTVGTLQLAAGDRIGVVSGGSQTNLVGMAIVITMKRI